jgi:four helix bundle protein
MFVHERLDVYKISLQYVKWVYDIEDRLTGKHRHAKDQLLRASQSITLNIAEGNGKSSYKDRSRFFEITRGSTLECAAIQDVLEIGGILNKNENKNAKQLLLRIVSMLTKLSQKGYSVHEDDVEYNIDYDNDYDSDGEDKNAL